MTCEFDTSGLLLPDSLGVAAPDSLSLINRRRKTSVSDQLWDVLVG